MVLDTNVLVSGLLNPNGPPAAILNLLVNGKIRLLYDNRILQEYSEVLRRDKFGFNKESIDVLINYFQDVGEFISAEPTNREFDDENDRIFHEVMITGEANYLVSGNLVHYPKSNKIIDPRRFITIYEKLNKGK